MLNLLENKILKFLDNIYGFYVYDLINYIGYNINNINRFNKGFIGNLIESYINLNINKKNICDISLINLEIKTFSIDYNINLLNDISLVTFKYFRYLNIYIILEKLFYKIKNILFVPILSNKNSCIEDKVIGKSFIIKFSKYNILSFKNELYDLSILFSNNINILNSYYTKSFRLYFFINKNNKIYLNIFFRKNFIFKLINKYNIIL